MELVHNCKYIALTRVHPLINCRNEILEAEGVVPDYEDGIRITGKLQSARSRN